MSKNNRKCYLCGKTYYYCPNCTNDYNKPTWMFMFESENCFKIFNALQLHYQKSLTDEEMLTIIDNSDISELETFTEIPKRQIKDLLSKRKNQVTEINETDTQKVKTVPKKSTRNKK